MPASRHMLRRSTLWGAVCIFALAMPAGAQVQTTVTSATPSLSQSPDDPDAIYCRPPQRQSDSRLPGPQVCKTNRQWAALHAQGLDISADGKSTVESEKYRTLQKGPCHTLQDNCF